ncbi:uncharacterized protein V6R79_020803 [Siganus canaliculatus]
MSPKIKSSTTPEIATVIITVSVFILEHMTPISPEPALSAAVASSLWPFFHSRNSGGLVFKLSQQGSTSHSGRFPAHYLAPR